ncbi:MAG TPA: glycosyltransferase family 87 protein [Terracidiphilus sp.]
MTNQRDWTALSIAIACALGVVFTLLFLSILSFNPALVARRDFIVYWATGHQLVQHGNPYEPASISAIERAAGFRGPGSFYMRNTPWALPLAYPLGFFSPIASALPWSLIMLALLIVSVRILWNLFGRSGNHPATQLAWLGYCFPPALFCVILGQTSILVLTGLALFLRLHKSRPFAAGAALWLCTLKPHLLLPFALILLAWIVVFRSYRILAGALAAFALGALLTSLIDPAAWSQYSFYMRTSVITREFTPCLGDLLRDRINPSAEWIAFIPAALGCVWALAYFWPRRHSWDWLEHGSPLILVSLLVAPFGWIFDQSVALPAVLYAVSRNPSKAMLSFLALIYVLIEIQIVSPFGLHSPLYIWVAPAWLIWYLFARASFPHAAVPVVAAS